MENLQIVKEYNNTSSNKNNMDVFDIYVNDWGVLQYGFKYNEFHGLYEIHFMTTGKRVTGLNYEKMEKVLYKELEKDYDSEIYYADMDDQSVLDNIEDEHMEGLSLYLFDGWHIAFWN